MKKVLLGSFFLLWFTPLNAQEGTHKVQLDVGVGFTYYNVPNTLSVKINKAFAGLAHFDALFTVKTPLSIGFSFFHHSFFTEGDSNTRFIDARSNALFFIANYNVVDKQKFTFSVGSGFGVNGLRYQRIQATTASTANAIIQLGGSCFLLNAQVRYYFLKNLGAFFKTQFMVNNYKMKSLTVNNEPKTEIDNIPIDKVFYSFRGPSLQIGLSLRF